MIQRIWINQNGVQSGPFTMEELAQKAPLSRNTYVWFKGMADWQTIDKVAELADLVQPLTAEASEAPESAESDVATAEMASFPPEMPPVPEFVQQPQYGPMPQYAAQQPAVVPKCPPHNLFWSIVALIFCCSIPAIVAIIYGALVSSKYNQGDYAKAQKYSDISAWWCIAAIVLGVLSLPLSIIVTMMQ